MLFQYLDLDFVGQALRGQGKIFTPVWLLPYP